MNICYTGDSREIKDFQDKLNIFTETHFKDNKLVKIYEKDTKFNIYLDVQEKQINFLYKNKIISKIKNHDFNNILKDTKESLKLISTIYLEKNLISLGG